MELHLIRHGNAEGRAQNLCDEKTELSPSSDGAEPIRQQVEGEYAFFQHQSCEYFPCHKVDSPENFNCLFCYCPLYALGNQCGGHFVYTDKGIKDCSACTVPHQRENYGRILSHMKDLQKMAQEVGEASPD